MMKIATGLFKQARNLAHSLRRLTTSKGEGAARRSIGGRAHTLLTHGDEGGALVEIALAVPALLAVFTGIVAFGLAYSNQLTLTQAVGSAGQYLTQIRTSTTDPCLDTFNALKNAAPTLNSGSIVFTVSLNGTTPTMNGNSCAGSQTLLVQGTPVMVYATYPCGLSVLGSKFGNSCQIAAKVTEYEY
jgi:Flp pilus assembly protein TadG